MTKDIWTNFFGKFVEISNYCSLLSVNHWVVTLLNNRQLQIVSLSMTTISYADTSKPRPLETSKPILSCRPMTLKFSHFRHFLLFYLFTDF